MKDKYEKISHPINNNHHKSIMAKSLWFTTVFVHKSTISLPIWYWSYKKDDLPLEFTMFIHINMHIFKPKNIHHKKHVRHVVFKFYWKT